MDSISKKRCAYITEEQKAELVNFMRDHPQLTSGKFSSTFTVREARKLWNEVTEKLHNIPGASKTWQQWRKTWQDMRSKVKAKNTTIKNHAKGTGGGPASIQVLSQCEQDVMETMGSTIINGHDGVQESNVNFDWTNDDMKLPTSTAIEYLAEDDEIIRQFVLEKPASSSSVSCQPKLIEASMPDDLPGSSSVKKCEKMTAGLTPHLIPSSDQSSMPQLATPVRNGQTNRQLASSRRLEDSITHTQQLVNISKQDNLNRKGYYKRKLELYERYVVAKERDAVAKERIASLFETFISNFQQPT